MTMTKHMKRLLLTAALFSTPHALAQAAPQSAPTPTAIAPATQDADPAIWVVKDSDTTVYLFGTVHVLKPGLSWFDEAVKAAFDKSDEIVLEMVEPDPQTMGALIGKLGIAASGPKLSEKIPETNRPTLKIAANDLGVPPEMLERFKPWMASVMVGLAPLGKLGYSPESGAEKIITTAAKAASKQVIGLETAEQQLSYFDTLPENLQIKYLVDALDGYAKAGATIDKMVAEWAAGEPEKLGETLNEEMRKSPQLGKILLADRNQRWAEWIKARMDKPGTVFVAVGAGHLSGADSVQAYLAKHKLTAKRIKY